MASGISKDDDGYPWLSWALTGIVTLASVIIFGLVQSARIPPSPLPAGSGAADASKSPLPHPAVTKAVPASSAAPAPRSSADESTPAATEAEPAMPQKTPLPEAAPVAPAAVTAESVSPSPRVSLPAQQAPPAAQHSDGPSSPSPPSVTVQMGPEAVVATPPAAPQDAAKHAAFVRAVAEVRASMAQRNLAASKRSLETASLQVQGAADQTELERLQALQDHLEQFWGGIRKAVAAMQPTDEIELTASNRVAVIEASRETLAVQREGRPQRYRVETIPFDLLSAIVKSSFKPTPGSKLIVGSFLAMDAQGNRAAAVKLWQEAIRQGESQGKSLLPELDVPQAGRGKR